jgi:hypothetical protein
MKKDSKKIVSDCNSKIWERLNPERIVSKSRPLSPSPSDEKAREDFCVVIPFKGGRKPQNGQ